MTTQELAGLTLKSSVQDPERELVRAKLQEQLVDLLDLTLLSKQAHWNLIGREFAPLHEFLDVLVDELREYSDDMAERVTALGFAADGRSATVAQHSTVSTLPEGFLSTDDVSRAFTERLLEFTSVARERLKVVGEHDPVSEDLLIEMLRGLEKRLWMIQAQATV